MSISTLKDLLLEEVKDIYHAEKQLTKALPKMAQAAQMDELREAFEAHLEETNGQIDRLEKVFQLLEAPVRGKKCEAMEGLVKEGSEVLEEQMPPAIKDAALIGSAQKVEHYEIASYMTACSFAEQLELDEVVQLLTENLEEEEAASEKLSGLSEQCLALASENELAEETEQVE